MCGLYTISSSLNYASLFLILKRSSQAKPHTSKYIKYYNITFVINLILLVLISISNYIDVNKYFEIL